MRPLLNETGVQIVTVSTDTPSQIRAGRRLHGLNATMLADPTLKVIDLFGYRNRNFNNFKMPGRVGLPVPTSLLIDENGKVVWKDQSENYTQRSDPDFVRQALETKFDKSADR